jgi:Baseplate J-like protein
MVDSYIQLPITVDADALTQQILSNLASYFPGWVPREGNIEVALAEQIALLVAEAATAASDVPSLIFESFGTLVNITPIPGNYEQVQVTWTLTAPATGAGYQIPAGTIAGFYWQGAAYQFQTVQDYTIANGSSSMNLIMQSVATGAVYDLDAVATNSSLNPHQYLTLSTQDVLVSTVLIISTPSTLPTLTRGTDQETPSAYLNRLANELQLLAPRPITPNDYSAFSQNVSGIYRATTYDGINPLTNQALAVNANLTSQPSTPSGWTGIGDGTHNDTFALAGTAPTAYGAVTRTATSLVSGALLHAAAAQGATTIQVSITTPTFSTSLSASNPALVKIADAVNGNEVVIAIGATALASGYQTLTLASPLRVAHPITATATIYDGVMLPLVGAAPGSAGTLPSNTPNYIASAVTTPGTDSGATIVTAALVEYIDGSYVTFWSTPTPTTPASGTPLTTRVYIASSNVYTTTNNLAGSNPATLYNSIKPTICSVRMFVGWAGGIPGDTQEIYGSNVCQSSLFLVNGDDQPNLSTSFYNFIPDPSFNTYFYPNCNELTWTLPGSGVIALPGYGMQYSGTGSALGSPLTVNSQAFMLDNVATDLGTATSRTFSIIATVDASYTGTTYGDITVEVYSLTDSSVLASVSPTAAGIQNLVASFALAAPKAVIVKVIYGTGLNVPVNSSVIVSSLGVMNGNQTAAYYVNNNDLGYTYTPGGYYSTQNFVLARTVSVIPATVNGLAVSDSQVDALHTYLQGRREINFTTNILDPQFAPIDVQWSAYLASGYSASSVQAAVTSAIYSFLSPATWAGGESAPPYWDPAQNTVRILDIGSIIAQVPGISSVVSVLTRVSWPTSGSYGTADLTFQGVGVLPLGNAISGTILSNPLDALSSV